MSLSRLSLRGSNTCTKRLERGSSPCCCLLTRVRVRYGKTNTQMLVRVTGMDRVTLAVKVRVTVTVRVYKSVQIICVRVMVRAEEFSSVLRMLSQPKKVCGHQAQVRGRVRGRGRVRVTIRGRVRVIGLG